MNGTVKRYLPYIIIILAVYMLVPLLFLTDALNNLSPIAYYFIFPAAAIICSAHYCARYGLDFFFSLVAPVIFIPSMIVYNGGFKLTNIILLVAYLVASIFGLFIGDVAFGDKRRKEESEADSENEAMMLEAKRRDEELKKQRSAEAEREAARKTSGADSFDGDDSFDYGKYGGEIDESEINDILNEFGEGKHDEY